MAKEGGPGDILRGRIPWKRKGHTPEETHRESMDAAIKRSDIPDAFKEVPEMEQLDQETLALAVSAAQEILANTQDCDQHAANELAMTLAGPHTSAMSLIKQIMDLTPLQRDSNKIMYRAAAAALLQKKSSYELARKDTSK